MNDQQSIFDSLKEADNKELWVFAKEIADARKKNFKPKEESIELDLEDKGALRQRVMEHLFAESKRGNAQASDKLARIAGLGETEQDIVIEIVNYNPPKKKAVRKRKSTTKK